MRVLWVLEELGVPYETISVRFPPRVHQPSYLEVNPAGSLPAIIDGEVRMTESMAICHYLTHAYGPSDLVVPPGEPGYVDYLQFCYFGEATLMSPVGSMVHPKMFETPEQRTPGVLENARLSFARRIEPVRVALRRGEYLAAGRVTLADVSVAYALGLTALIGEGDLIPEDVRRYVDRLAQRPAYRRAYGLDVADAA